VQAVGGERKAFDREAANAKRHKSSSCFIIIICSRDGDDEYEIHQVSKNWRELLLTTDDATP
jgi:hypothetical protein